jgi:ADP-L-glycero-D-manno-heptose 6-epimerase
VIIVTGGAGFVGSNIVRALTARGEREIVVVDDLTDGRKFVNLVDGAVADYWDKDELIGRLRDGGRAQRPAAVFHEGACAVTTEWDGRYMMATNYRYSVDLLDYCLAEAVPLIYASSGAVYGRSGTCIESDRAAERPLNVYGYSKLLFDDYVRRRLPFARSQVVGLRYFNVYGPGESHKGPMASVAYQLHGQVLRDGEVRLFEGSDGYGPGEQRRDFVHVRDVAAVNLWFLDHPERSGIFNVGTGSSASFNELANAVLRWHGRGKIRYIPFPAGLEGRYQSFTEADIGELRRAGYDDAFLDVDAGVAAYLDALGADA